MSFTTIVSYALLDAMRFAIAVIMYRRGQQLNNKNFKKLGVILSVGGIASFFLLIDEFAVLPFTVSFGFTFFTLINILPGIDWIQNTFNKDQDDKTYKILLIIEAPAWIIGSILSFIDLYILDLSNPVLTFLRYLLFGVAIMLFEIWYLLVDLQALKRIKSSDQVEPWIKGRYKIIAVYTIGLIITGFAFVIYPLYTTPVIGEYSFPTLIIIATTPITVVGEFFAWYMPDGFKKYLNRNYTSVEDEDMSEEEIKRLLGGA